MEYISSYYTRDIISKSNCGQCNHSEEESFSKTPGFNCCENEGGNHTHEEKNQHKSCEDYYLLPGSFLSYLNIDYVLQGLNIHA